MPKSNQEFEQEPLKLNLKTSCFIKALMFRIPNEFCLKLGEFNSRNRGYLFEIYQVSNKMQLESWLIKCFVFLLWNTEGFFPQFLKDHLDFQQNQFRVTFGQSLL